MNLGLSPLERTGAVYPGAVFLDNRSVCCIRIHFFVHWSVMPLVEGVPGLSDHHAL